MENELEENIKIKIALTLNRLLEKNKDLKGKVNYASSYNQIALNAYIRKATVSNTFNAKSTPNFTTLIIIVEAMGYNLNDFAEVYSSINYEDILIYKKRKK